MDKSVEQRARDALLAAGVDKFFVNSKTLANLLTGEA